MSLGGWGRALAAYAVALAVASFGLSAWLRFGGAPAAGGEDVVSAWRGGARVARRVGVGLTAAAVATEAATPGTTVVLERVVGEGRVLTLGRRLFGLSFVAGRDGVRATLDGSEAVLTPDDLVAAGLYRRIGVDADGVLSRLAGELACAPERLWKSGRFRRFGVARTVLSSTPAPPAAAGGNAEDADRAGAKGDTTPTRVGDANWVAAKPGGAANAGSNAPAANAGAANAGQVGVVDTLPTGPRLARAVRETAAFLVRRLGEDGRFSELSAAGAGAQAGAGAGAPNDAPAYDWRRHAVATAFLAEADNELDDLGLRIAAQRAGWVMRTAGLGRCGGEACLGEGEQVATGASAAAALAFSALGSVRVGASFREPARELAAFLRGQQRPDGGFWAGYDRARQAPATTWGERADVDATAALALARAYRITRAPADLAAAARALDHLARRPGWLGVRNPLSVDPRLCVAADEIGRREGGARAAAGGTAAAKGGLDTAPASAEGAAAREICLEAAEASGGLLELGRSPVADYAGGVRCGLGWMPDLRATAERTEASTAALAIGLGAGRSFRSLTPLGARVTRGLEFMLRTQLPGTCPYLVGDPVAAAGGFPASPVETAPRIEVSAAAGSAMLRYIELLEVRGMPTANTRRPRK